MRTVLFIFLSTISVLTYSKDFKGAVKLYSGTELGWWIYNLGSENGIHKGYGRTDLKILIPLGIEFQLRNKNFSTGLGSSSTWLFDDKMEFNNYSTFGESEVKIGDRTVHSINLYALVAYKLIEANRFSISPTARLGTFWFYSTYSDSKEMNQRFYSEFGVVLKHRVHDLSFEIAPMIHLLSSKGAREDSSHSIYGFGIQYGVSWEIF